MKLMSVDEFIETFYTAKSRPIRRTIINRIMSGAIPGKLDGGRYMVDVDAYLKLTGNVLVDQVACGAVYKKRRRK
jgi:hypothetical protein